MDMMNLFKRLGQDRSGHIAIIFALCIIPVVSIAGFAIDFSLLSSNKNKVQRSVDASVLAGARAMQAGKTQQEIRNVMYDYMRGQSQTSSNNGYNCYSMNVQFPQGSQDIAASIICEQSATLMQVVGKDKLKFGVSSTSTWGIGKLDVAFMFDVSGSMSWKPPGAGSGDPNRIT
jgi:Flp pilus assembly protein TadG